VWTANPGEMKITIFWFFVDWRIADDAARGGASGPLRMVSCPRDGHFNFILPSSHRTQRIRNREFAVHFCCICAKRFESEPAPRRERHAFHFSRLVSTYFGSPAFFLGLRSNLLYLGTYLWNTSFAYGQQNNATGQIFAVQGTDPTNLPILDSNQTTAFSISPTVPWFHVSFANLHIIHCSTGSPLSSLHQFDWLIVFAINFVVGCFLLETTSIPWSLALSNVVIEDVNANAAALYSTATQVTITDSIFSNCQGNAVELESGTSSKSVSLTLAEFSHNIP